MKELQKTFKKLDEIADQAMSDYAVASKVDKKKLLDVMLRTLQLKKNLQDNTGH